MDGKPCNCPALASDLFTCGRRPAGLLATLVVVVVVVVVIIIVWGGNNFYTWALPETMYGFEKNKSKTPFFLFFLFSFFISKAYVWFGCSCMV